MLIIKRSPADRRPYVEDDSSCRNHSTFAEGPYFLPVPQNIEIYVGRANQRQIHTLLEFAGFGFLDRLGYLSSERCTVIRPPRT